MEKNSEKMNKLAETSDKLIKFLEQVQRNFSIQQEKQSSFSSRVDLIKTTLSFYELSVYEFCNELNQHFLENLSRFLKKLCHNYHEILLFLIKFIFQGLLARIPAERLENFKEISLFSHKIDENSSQHNKTVDLFHENLIKSKMDSYVREINELRDSLKKKERLIHEMHLEIQQNHLVQTRLQDLCVREIRTHFTQKAYELHLTTGKPDISLINARKTDKNGTPTSVLERKTEKNKEKFTVVQKKPANISQKPPENPESQEIFFREFEKLVSKELQTLETRIQKAISVDFTKKRRSYSSQKTHNLSKSLNLDGDSPLEDSQFNELSPKSQEFMSLLSEALTNHDKTLENAKEAGVAWELNRILQQILAKRYEYNLRDSQVNQIMHENLNYSSHFPRTSSSFSQSTVFGFKNRLGLRESSKKKKKVKRIIEKFKEIERNDAANDPIFKDFEEVEELKMEIASFKEKNKGLFQETKVLSREIEKKNKEIKELKAEINEIKLKLLEEVKRNGPLKLKIEDLQQNLNVLQCQIVPLEEKLAKKKQAIKEIKQKLQKQGSSLQEMDNFKRLREKTDALVKENTELTAKLVNFQLIFKHGSTKINEFPENAENLSKFQGKEGNFGDKKEQNLLRNQVSRMERYLKDAEDKEFSHEIVIQNLMKRNQELMEEVQAIKDQKIVNSSKDYDDYMGEVEKKLGKNIRNPAEKPEKQENDGKNLRNSSSGGRIKAKSIANKQKNLEKPKGNEEKSAKKTQKSLKNEQSIEKIAEDKVHYKEIEENLDENLKNYREIAEIKEEIHNFSRENSENYGDGEVEEKKHVNFQANERSFRKNPQQKLHKSKTVYESANKKDHLPYIPTKKTRENAIIEEKSAFSSDYLADVREKIGNFRENMANLQRNEPSRIDFSIVNKKTEDMMAKPHDFSKKSNEIAENMENFEKKQQIIVYPMEKPSGRIQVQSQIQEIPEKNQKNQEDSLKPQQKVDKINSNNIKDSKNDAISSHFLNKYTQTERIPSKNRSTQTEILEIHLKPSENQTNSNDFSKKPARNARKPSKSEHKAEEAQSFEKKVQQNPELLQILKKEGLYDNSFRKKSLQSDKRTVQSSQTLNTSKNLANLANLEARSLENRDLLGWIDENSDFLALKEGNRDKNSQSATIIQMKLKKQEENSMKSSNFNEKFESKEKNARDNALKSELKSRNVVFVVKKPEISDSYENYLDNSKDFKIDPQKQRETSQKTEDLSVFSEKECEILYENLKSGLTNPEGFMKNLPKSLESVFFELLAIKALSSNELPNDVSKALNVKKLVIEILLPEFKVFRRFLRDFREIHEKCGKDCIHLKRFYEKLGVFKESGRVNVQLHKRDINKFPKLFKNYAEKL